MGLNRIYYATYQVGIAPLGNTTLTAIRGLQSASMNTTFNLEQAFEIGMQAIYENIEGIPDIECTMEKVLDGSCPIYLLATYGTATDATLGGRSDARSTIGFQFYEDTVSAVGYGGAAPVSAVSLSGMYVSSVGYAVPVDGNATESVTFVGNNKAWGNGDSLTFASNPFVNNEDSPVAIAGSGGVNRRENIMLGLTGSVFPPEIPGVTNQGGGSGRIVLSGNEYPVHPQSISINVDLGREEMFELGRRGPYYRFVNFPTEVTTEIVVVSRSGDMINATEDVTVGTCSTTDNLQNSAIVLKMCEGLVVDCGHKNKLSSVNDTGGDATGGNREITYSYSTFNDFAVYHPQDPVAGEAGFSYS